MKEFIDKLISRLEEKHIQLYGEELGKAVKLSEAISIVNSLAEEYKLFGNSEQVKVSEMPTGWITDRVPTKEECGNYGKEFLTTIPQGDGYKTVAMRYEYTTVRGKEVSRWTKYGRIAPWEPIAWMPLPAPYTEGE